MGKALIIKDADFSTNSVATIEEMYEDITDTLINGVFASSGGSVILFNSAYNSSNTLIPNFLTLMLNSTSLYQSYNKGVEWFIPNSLRFLPIVYKTTSTIGSSGTVSNCVTNQPAKYIIGSDTWVKASDIYTFLGQSEITYPNYCGSVCKPGSSASLTLVEAKALGLRVRKLRNT